MSNHNCNYLVFRCMDFRIKPSILSELLKNEGIDEGDFDLVSVAGAAKDLLLSESEQDFLLKQISLSKKLHNTKKIVILYHENCGAYGIPDKEQEKQTQLADLNKIKLQIAEKFPDLEFAAYIINGVETGNLSLEKAI